MLEETNKQNKETTMHYEITYTLNENPEKTVLFKTKKRKWNTVFAAFKESLPEYNTGNYDLKIRDIQQIHYTTHVDVDGNGRKFSYRTCTNSPL